MATSPPLDFSRYRGDIRRFLADTASEPTVADSLFLSDREGHDWVPLESFLNKVDPMADKGWRGLQEKSTIHTLLVKADDANALLKALRDESRHDTRDLLDSHGHTDCCYVGEVGRIGPNCPHRHDTLRRVSIGGKEVEIVPTIEQYTWEGSTLDCSIGETASVDLPATFIQQAAGLTFDMRGPSWLDSAGAPMFIHYEQLGNDSRAILVRKFFLHNFLMEHNLELIVWHWYERMQLRDDYHQDQHPYVESSVIARLGADMKIRQGTPQRTERDLE